MGRRLRGIPVAEPAAPPRLGVFPAIAVLMEDDDSSLLILPEEACLGVADPDDFGVEVPDLGVVPPDGIRCPVADVGDSSMGLPSSFNGTSCV